MSRPGVVSAVSLAMLGVLIAPPAFAQWLHYPVPGTPRTRDGKPELTARAPRTREGKPASLRHLAALGRPVLQQHRGGSETRRRPAVGRRDLSAAKRGLRQRQHGSAVSAIWSRRDHHALRRRQDRPDAFAGRDSLERSHISPGPHGWPTAAEGSESHLDGYSVGRWEGDTLVVESTGFTERVWLDYDGHPHTEALRMIERYRRRDFGHLDLGVTFEDPGVYSRPWTVTVPLDLFPDTELLEAVCKENEKDFARMSSRPEGQAIVGFKVPRDTLAGYAGAVPDPEKGARQAGCHLAVGRFVVPGH